jgi:hypothetical protein
VFLNAPRPLRIIAMGLRKLFFVECVVCQPSENFVSFVLKHLFSIISLLCFRFFFASFCFSSFCLVSSSFCLVSSSFCLVSSSFYFISFLLYFILFRFSLLCFVHVLVPVFFPFHLALFPFFFLFE